MNKPKNVTYGILTWGPCVLKLKITDEFFELLKKESEASVKKELSYNHRLAGIIQKEYKLRDLKILQPFMKDIVNIYDQVWDKWRNSDKPSNNKYLINMTEKEFINDIETATKIFKKN